MSNVPPRVRVLIGVSALAVGSVLVTLLLLSVLSEKPTAPEPPTDTFLGDTASFQLPSEAGRSAVVRIVGDAFGWNDATRTQFNGTFAALQWNRHNSHLLEYVSNELDLNQIEQETFLAFGPSLTNHNIDLLTYFHATGSFAFPREENPRAVAEALLLQEGTSTDNLGRTVMERLVPNEQLTALHEFLASELEKLPDLSPLPPLDLELSTENGRDTLRFTTVYYNQGDGPLELRADPSTRDVPGDVTRDVFQRIYRLDGTYRDRPAGSFVWHQEHLHYHFSDFVDYSLQAVDVPQYGSNQVVGREEKSTFCVRDVSRVMLDGQEPSSATYEVCGRERQGVSVGWGDAYFHDYADQLIDMTNLPSGTYRLVFSVNPRDRFAEKTKANNTSSALFDFDSRAKTITIRERNPSSFPDFEHINVKDIYVPSQ